MLKSQSHHNKQLPTLNFHQCLKFRSWWPPCSNNDPFFYIECKVPPLVHLNINMFKFRYKIYLNWLATNSTQRITFVLPFFLSSMNINAPKKMNATITTLSRCGKCHVKQIFWCQILWVLQEHSLNFFSLPFIVA